MQQHSIILEQSDEHSNDKMPEYRLQNFKDLRNILQANAKPGVKYLRQQKQQVIEGNPANSNTSQIDPNTCAHPNFESAYNFRQIPHSQIMSQYGVGQTLIDDANVNQSLIEQIYVPSKYSSISGGYIKKPPSQISEQYVEQAKTSIQRTLSRSLSKTLLLRSDQWFQPCKQQVITNNVGLLRMSGSMHGTAFLYKKRFAITCAHNLYDIEKSQIKTGPQYLEIASKSDSSPSQKYMIGRVFFPKIYQNSRNTKLTRMNYDLALLQLLEIDRKEEDQDYAKANFIKVDDEILIYGFPRRIGSASTQVVGEEKLLGTNGKVIRLENGLIWYDNLTSEGQSGSPIWKRNSQNGLELVGIHLGFDRPKQLSYGLVFNQERWKYFRYWQCEVQNVLDLIKISLKGNQRKYRIFQQKTS